MCCDNHNHECRRPAPAPVKCAKCKGTGQWVPGVGGTCEVCKGIGQVIPRSA